MEYIHTVVLPTPHTSTTLTHGRLFFIGNATVLLNYAGFTILTDPNFLHQGEYAHLGFGLRTQRLTNPAITIHQLPALDLIVLSHLHDDHFDHIACSQLKKNTPIITTPQATTALKKKGFYLSHPLATWQTITMVKGENKLRITALPGKHAPGILGRILPPVMGSLLEFETPEAQIALRVYITGDTIIHPALKEIPHHYSHIDLALLHLGGTRILGVTVTMNTRQGVEMMRLIQPHRAIPIHFNDYICFKSPLDDFKTAITHAGLEERMNYLLAGYTYTFEVPRSRLSPRTKQTEQRR